MKKSMKKKIVLLLLLIPSLSLFSQSSDIENKDSFNKYRFGGYGEILFQQMNYGPNRYSNPEGAPKDDRSYISLPRAIFAFDYKFREDIIFSTEIEIEYGGTGSAMEIEYNKEGGEYESEIEKGGEVVLEQFHFTKKFSNAFNVRIGHMIVPIGLTNAHHEPILFFTTTRPEGETTIIPCTWHETGIAFLGTINKFYYELMLVNGLDPNGFSTENWIGSGKQAIFETTTMTNPALAARVEYSGIKGLRIGASGYYGNTAKNSSKPNYMDGLKGTVSLVSGDLQYINKNLTARANFIYGTVTDSKEIFIVNKNYFKRTGFPVTEFGESAMTYAFEAGYNILSFFNTKEKLYPFARYEYYNSVESTEGETKSFDRYKRDIFTFGLNYSVCPGLVLKADYAIRRICKGKYNNENTFGLSLAYTGWLLSK